MKKGISVLLALLLAAGIFCYGGITPASADADSVLKTELFTDSEDDDETQATEINLNDIKDDVYTISEEGTYQLSGKYNGQILINAPEVKVKLILKDAEISNTGSAAIYVEDADKVVISMAEGSSSTIESKGQNEDIDAAIYSRKDLNIKGKGTLTVISEEGHGILSKKDLKIKNGTINIEAGCDAINCGDDAEITGGILTITAGDDAIHADSSLTITDGEIIIEKCYEGLEALSINISGGSIDIYAEDDGINASAGKDAETSEYQPGNSDDKEPPEMPEGEEPPEMPEGEEPPEMPGGERPDMDGTEPPAKPDGDGGNRPDGMGGGAGMGGNPGMGGGAENPFTVTEGAEVVISGGKINIVSFGDGIDSNGSLTVSGGEIYISGPLSTGDSALDYASEAVITGGIVFAAGPADMAEGFSNSSEQASILYSFDSKYPAGTEVSLEDSNGNVLISCMPENDFSSVVVSVPDLESSGTYCLKVGDEEFTIEMNGTVFSNGKQGGQQGGQPQEMSNGERPDMGDTQPPEMPDGEQGGPGGGQGGGPGGPGGGPGGMGQPGGNPGNGSMT